VYQYDYKTYFYTITIKRGTYVPLRYVVVEQPTAKRTRETLIAHIMVIINNHKHMYKYDVEWPGIVSLFAFCRHLVFVKKTRNSLPEFDLLRGPRRFSALRTHVLGII